MLEELRVTAKACGVVERDAEGRIAGKYVKLSEAEKESTHGRPTSGGGSSLGSVERSLPCARAHAEPVAHERHELMPDVHRAKRAAQPPHSGPGHPR